MNVLKPCKTLMKYKNCTNRASKYLSQCQIFKLLPVEKDEHVTIIRGARPLLLSIRSINNMRRS